MADFTDKSPRGKADKTIACTTGAPSPEVGLSRRRLFGTLIGSAAAVGAGLAVLRSGPADAQSKTPKKVAKYQDHPKNGQQCSKCRFFRPPHSCQLVAGNISPNGWCSFYAKKPA